MGEKTNIGWTDATWNFIRAINKLTGALGWFCTKRTRACVNCYASDYNVRRGNGLEYTRPNLKYIEWTVPEHQLIAPFGWKEAQWCFVNSMTDFFHPAIPDWMRRLGFVVMLLRRDCTFQILTKQPECMQHFFAANTMADCINEIASTSRKQEYPELWRRFESSQSDLFASTGRVGIHPWPLENVHLGVSVGEESDLFFLSLLRGTPAAKRFVSFEPLLHRIPMLEDYLWEIDWAIIGGESGPNRRDCGVEALAETWYQCGKANVRTYVKQDCALHPGQQGRLSVNVWNTKEMPVP